MSKPETGWEMVTQMREATQDFIHPHDPKLDKERHRTLDDCADTLQSFLERLDALEHGLRIPKTFPAGCPFKGEQRMIAEAMVEAVNDARLLIADELRAMIGRKP